MSKMNEKNKKKNRSRAGGKPDARRAGKTQNGRARKSVAGKKEREKTVMIVGTFRGTGRGYAFLTPDEGKEDYFIPPHGLGGALNGDRVTAEIRTLADGKKEAFVRDVIRQTTVYVVGTFEENRLGEPVIYPDDGKVCRLFHIENMRGLKPKTGYKVVGLPKERDGDTLFGDLIEVLGEPNVKNVDILSVARAYGLTEEFPPEAEAVARQMGFEVAEEDMIGREDFRCDTVVTIDGIDAKDLDDAVSVRKENGHYVLSVHIADVSHYVKENGAIDREAFKRATSVYFPGCVFPMLPRELSNGICSLNPQVNRLTLSCIMEIDGGGNVLKARVTKGLIKTKRRMNYDNVAAILEGDAKERSENADVCEMLDTAKELALLLNKKRISRGSIEFDIPESKILLDDNGVCVGVELYEHKISHMVVEEFMLAANESIAAMFDKMKAPFVYRVHENPPPDKELAYIDYLESLGIEFSGGSSADYAAFLRRMKGNPNERAVSRIGLRTMAKAKYMTKDTGHFGLAAKHYCHFTSPIRRYPDLQIHRIISDYLAHGGAYIKKYAKTVVESAAQSSAREQIALTAERRADDLKKAEYMKAHIGEAFDAAVSSVTEWGIFVELPNGIEGLVRKEALGDTAEFDEKRHILRVGDTVYTIGRELRVKCDCVENGKIDFVPVKETVLQK